MKSRLLADFESEATISLLSEAKILTDPSAFKGAAYARLTVPSSGVELSRSSAVRESYTTPRNMPVTDGFLIYMRAANQYSSDHLMTTLAGGPLVIKQRDPALAFSTYTGICPVGLRPELWEAVFFPSPLFDIPLHPQTTGISVQILSLLAGDQIIVDIDAIFGVTWNRSVSEV